MVAFCKTLYVGVQMRKNERARLARDNSQFISRLSLERCRSYVTHMRAILHVCEETGEDVADALHHMMQALDMELDHHLQKIG